MKKKRFKNGAIPRRPGRSNFPFHKKPYDIAYARPGERISASKKNPSKFIKKKYDANPHLPF